MSVRDASASPPRPESLQRLFFALWPDARLREALASWVRARQPAVVGRLQRPDQWHVTLEFLGAVPADRVAAVRAAAGEVGARAFEIRFDAVDYWRRPRVLCLVARVVPAALTELVRDLRARLAAHGFETEHRPYVPHLTLARKLSRPVELPAFEPLRWPAAEFVLVESVTERSGVRYTPLAAWPLSD